MCMYVSIDKDIPRAREAERQQSRSDDSRSSTNFSTTEKLCFRV